LAADVVSLVPVFKIEVDGTELAAGSRAAVQGVRFEDELNVASMFVLKLSTSDIEKGTGNFLDLKNFILAAKSGYISEWNSYEEMMVGGNNLN